MKIELCFTMNQINDIIIILIKRSYVPYNFIKTRNHRVGSLWISYNNNLIKQTLTDI